MNRDELGLLVFQAVAAPLAMLSVGGFGIISMAVYLELVERLRLRLRPTQSTPHQQQSERYYE